MTQEEQVAASQEMWGKLARQLADAIPDLVIADRPGRALQYALCADNCFWHATGEGDVPTMLDTIKLVDRPLASGETAHD